VEKGSGIFSRRKGGLESMQKTKRGSGDDADEGRGSGGVSAGRKGMLKGNCYRKKSAVIEKKRGGGIC